MSEEEYEKNINSNGSCSVCTLNKQLRYGVCYDCCEAESIIDDGLDMEDKPFIDKNTIPMSTMLLKLKYLISKGWRFNSVKPGKIQDINTIKISSFKDKITSLFCKHEFRASRTENIIGSDFDLIVKCNKCKAKYIGKDFFK